MIDKYKCNCTNPGSCEIDVDKQNRLTCGVVGLVDIQNVRLIDGVVECASCRMAIYEEL